MQIVPSSMQGTSRSPIDYWRNHVQKQSPCMLGPIRESKPENQVRFDHSLPRSQPHDSVIFDVPEIEYLCHLNKFHCYNSKTVFVYQQFLRH